MWRQHKLRLDFVTELCGGVPRNDALVDDWIRARAATDAALERMKNGTGPSGAEPKDLDEVAAERKETTDVLDSRIDEATQKIWVGFSRDERGLFVRGANLRAHLKDCADVLSKAAKAGGLEGVDKVLNFRAKFVNAIYIKEDRLHIRNPDGVIVTQATGHRDASMTVMTPRGPRTCLKRVDYITPARIEATLLMLEHSEISLEHVARCLEYGCVHGFGQDRSLQFGRYEWVLDDKPRESDADV